MKMINVRFQGGEITVMEEVFGSCPKCGGDTFGENEFVYADDPYGMELCPSCGWWANSIMNSDDMEEEDVDTREMVEEEQENVVDKFTDCFAQLYARMFKTAYGIAIDFDNDQIPVDDFLMKEAFNKSCYEFGVVAKAFGVDEAYRSDKVIVMNMNMFAIIPEDDGKSMGVFDTTLTDVTEL